MFSLDPAKPKSSELGILQKLHEEQAGPPWHQRFFGAKKNDSEEVWFFNRWLANTGTWGVQVYDGMLVWCLDNLVLGTSGDFLSLGPYYLVPFRDYFLFFLGFLSKSK